MTGTSGRDRNVRWSRMRLAFFVLLVPAQVSLSEVVRGVKNPQQPLQQDTEKASFASQWYDSLQLWLDGGSSSTADDRDLKSDSESGSRDGDDYWSKAEEYTYTGDDDYYNFKGDPPLPTLSPVGRRDVIGFMLSSLGVTLGSSGGIGGGGIVVPIYIIVLGFSPRFAIPLGSVTVLGGALAGLILNMRKRHPLADRPIIDWDVILVMEPLVLVGALFGGLLHRVVAEKILTVLLVLLLGVVAHTTLNKAKRMYNAERRYIEHLKAAKWDYLGRIGSMGDSVFRTTGWSQEALPPNVQYDPENKTNSPLAPSSPLRTLSMESRSTIRYIDADEKQRILILNPDFVTLRTDILEQEKVTPRNKIMVLLAKFSVLIFLNITLGGGAFRSPWGIQCASPSYWVVHVIMVAFLLSSAWAAQTYLINRHELKEIVRFDYVHGDIKWDPRNSVIYPFFFMCSGLCAGMFGVGGGMITVPLMLTMGVHPSVVTATSSSMVFFTALLSASSFAVFGLVLWDYAVVCLAIGFLASLMGQIFMKSVRQTNTEGHANFERNSFIAYCTGGVILLSALLLTMQYVLKIVSYNDTESDEGGLCEGYRMY